MVKKCDICGEKIEVTFLGKFVGTQVGKKFVCSKCQKEYKDSLKEKLGLKS